MSRYAYADPPYPQQARRHYKAEAEADGRVALEVNHAVLVGSLSDQYPDGWALSTSSTALRLVLEVCPADVRVAAWCKSFASFKPGVNPGYCWEPVILRGGRPKRDRSEPTVRDFLVEPIAMKKGVSGAKPARFAHWICDLLGVLPGDTIDDLFPGSGACRRAFDGYLGLTLTEPESLFEAAP